MSSDDLAGRLEAFMREETGLDDLEVCDLTPLTGGYSLQTTRFSTKSSGGDAVYVLRANPPGDAALTQTDRVQEWAILSALTEGGGVPMPAARWADVDGTRLGSLAIIIDHVDGPQLLHHLQDADDAARADLALDLAGTLGVLHRRCEALIPPSLERPDSWDAYIDGFIEGWRQVEAAYPEHNPFIRWVASWLDSHRPPPAPLTLVHGEFQTGNVMLDAAGRMQVIDWEYAHVGDPRVDLGWLQNVAAFTPPDLIAVDPMAFCERYCEASGLSLEIVDPLTVGWFSILAGYKAFGGLMQGMAALATGTNHLLTSAYLVSALPFTHRLWRQGVEAMDSAMAAMEAVS